MLTSETNDLDPKSYFEPDRITIVSGKDTRPKSVAECDAEARLIADREFERYMLSRVKPARSPAPSEESKPLAVVPNAAQDLAIKPQIAVKSVPVISQEDLRVIPGFEARGVDKVVADDWRQLEFPANDN